MYRPIDIQFWQDDFILDLTPKQKLFYLFLLTNRRTTQCGIYNLGLTISMVELQYSQEEIIEELSFFVEKGKILYNEETREVMILNWHKYNNIHNHKNIRTCINKELKRIKTVKFIRCFYETCKNICKEQPELLEEIFKDIDFKENPFEENIEKQTNTKSKEANKQLEDREEIKALGQQQEVPCEHINNKVTPFKHKAESEVATDKEEYKVSEISKKNKSTNKVRNKVLQCFKNNFHSPSPIEIEKLNNWVQQLGEALVLKALEEAVYQNKGNLNYVWGILNNWLAEGVTSLEEAEALIKKYRAHKNTDKDKQNNMASRIYSRNLLEID